MVDSVNTTARELKRERTVLLGRSNDGAIRASLIESGFTIVTWPELAIQPPQSFAALDEAVENLFGYDWLIFVNHEAVRFFLMRFSARGHDVSELDAARVCAIGEDTAAALEQTQVHVDVVSTNSSATGVIESIANYVGGRGHLRQLNFLIPQASIGRDYLKPELEATEARADVAVAYQTVEMTDATRLTALQTLLLTGSVDAVVFANETEVCNLSRLFDTNDLGRLLKINVFAADERAATVLKDFGVSPSLISVRHSQDSIVEALLGSGSV